LNDLRRRFRNWGISDAYYASFYGWTFRQLLSDIYLKNRKLIRKLCGAVLRRECSWREVVFEIEYYRYYIKYLWRYRFNSMVRQEVKTKDWLFSSNYEAPPAVFTIQCGQIGISEADQPQYNFDQAV
jgi:hypothetical protein